MNPLLRLYAAVKRKQNPNIGLKNRRIWWYFSEDLICSDILVQWFYDYSKNDK